ncbi:MAG: diaminopimelate decarboxylase [Pseudomonadota bacterium]
MDHFHYQNGQLYAEQVDVADIATDVGTPCYIYSRATLERHWRAFDDAFGSHPHQICYAVKANSNLAVLNLFARLGSGFDIVSGGELKRVIAAGGDPAKTIFSGVGKESWEIELAIENGIESFNIESDGELERIIDIATRLNTVASISVRINPDVDARTHPYISTGLRENKFGLHPDQAVSVYRKAHDHPSINVRGVACHIGSQLTELDPYRDALDRVLGFIGRLEDEDIPVEWIDFGGGLGVRYSDETPPSPAEYCAVIRERLEANKCSLPVAIEPGRAIVGNAGILLTRVNYLKSGDATDFCVVDAAMNDLIRPALYQAYQEIIPVNQNFEGAMTEFDVVGPVCESADFLGKKRSLKTGEGELLAVRTSGAYAAVMSSNYNSRPRTPEVLVDGDRYQIVRSRESLDDIFANERVLAW